MKFDEEMEQAAKKIQNRYRKKQNNREKQPRNQQKESNVPPKHEIPGLISHKSLNFKKNLKS